MVQDPSLNPFGEFLPGSAPSCMVLPFPIPAVQSLSSALPVVDIFVLSSLQFSYPETAARL